MQYTIVLVMKFIITLLFALSCIHTLNKYSMTDTALGNAGWNTKPILTYLFDDLQEKVESMGNKLLYRNKKKILNAIKKYGETNVKYIIHSYILDIGYGLHNEGLLTDKTDQVKELFDSYHEIPKEELQYYIKQLTNINGMDINDEELYKKIFEVSKNDSNINTNAIAHFATQAYDYLVKEGTLQSEQLNTAAVANKISDASSVKNKETEQTLTNTQTTVKGSYTKVSANAQNAVPKNTQNAVSANAQNTVPINAKNEIPENTQNAVSTNTQNAVPENAKNAIPKNTQNAIPKNTQNAISKNTQKAIPKNTQNAIPKNVQKAIPKNTQNAGSTNAKNAVSTNAKNAVSTNTQKAIPINAVDTSVTNTPVDSANAKNKLHTKLSKYMSRHRVGKHKKSIAILSTVLGIMGIGGAYYATGSTDALDTIGSDTDTEVLNDTNDTAQRHGVCIATITACTVLLALCAIVTYFITKKKKQPDITYTAMGLIQPINI